MWCRNSSKGYNLKFRKKMNLFYRYIRFEFIPCDVIVQEIYPLNIVPNFTLIRALAHQADPSLEDFPSMEDLVLSPSPSRNSPTVNSTLFHISDLKNHSEEADEECGEEVQERN